MNTLKIDTVDKSLAIKELNKFRLDNKNKWYQAEIRINKDVYKIKAFNTWLQIFRKCDTNHNIIYNSSNPMDQTVGEFKNWLNKHID
jgi:hypothetical protein